MERSFPGAVDFRGGLYVRISTGPTEVPIRRIVDLLVLWALGLDADQHSEMQGYGPPDAPTLTAGLDRICSTKIGNDNRQTLVTRADTALCFNYISDHRDRQTMLETPARIEPCLFEDRIPADLADLAV